VPARLKPLAAQGAAASKDTHVWRCAFATMTAAILKKLVLVTLIVVTLSDIIHGHIYDDTYLYRWIYMVYIAASYCYVDCLT